MYPPHPHPTNVHVMTQPQASLLKQHHLPPHQLGPNGMPITASAPTSGSSTPVLSSGISCTVTPYVKSELDDRKNDLIKETISKLNTKEVRGGRSPSKGNAAGGVSGGRGPVQAKEPLYLTLREKRLAVARSRREAAKAIAASTGPAVAAATSSARDDDDDDDEAVRKQLVLRAVEMQTKTGKRVQGRGRKSKQGKREAGEEDNDDGEEEEENKPLHQKKRRLSDLQATQHNNSAEGLDNGGTRSKREKVSQLSIQYPIP